jgi:hypothetical protein
MYQYGKARGKRPPRKPRSRRNVNKAMDVGETEWSGVDWFYLAQD